MSCKLFEMLEYDIKLILDKMQNMKHMKLVM